LNKDNWRFSQDKEEVWFKTGFNDSKWLKKKDVLLLYFPELSASSNNLILYPQDFFLRGDLYLEREDLRKDIYLFVSSILSTHSLINAYVNGNLVYTQDNQINPKSSTKINIRQYVRTGNNLIALEFKFSESILYEETVTRYEIAELISK